MAARDIKRAATVFHSPRDSMRQLPSLLPSIAIGLLAGAALCHCRHPKALCSVLSEAVPTKSTTVSADGLPAVDVETAPSKSLDWSRIASPDRAAFAANLRAIGCPEATIERILGPASEQQQAGSASNASILKEFWRSGFLDGRTATTTGDSPDASDAPLPDADVSASQDLSFLPGAQAKAVRAWRERLDSSGSAQENPVTPDGDLEPLAEVAERNEAELEAILTPGQLEEYRLRFSEVSNDLRSSLVGFEVTEDEFRRAFRALLDEQRSVRQGEFQSADESIRQILGDERFQRFGAAQDPDFRELAQEVLAAGHTYEDAVLIQRLIADAANPNARADGRDLALGSGDGSPIPAMSGELRMIYLARLSTAGRP